MSLTVGNTRVIKKAACTFFVLVFSVLLFVLLNFSANACDVCTVKDCATTKERIISYHAQGEAHINNHIDTRFPEFKNWMVEIFFKQNLLPAMMMMTEQLSAVGMHQMFSVGIMFDAKEQLETQRLFQKLKGDAINTYYPSEEMCYFGSNVRSLSHAQSRADTTAKAMNAIAMARFTGEFNNSASHGIAQDKRDRWQRFAERYCNPYNNAFDPKATDADGMPFKYTGLGLACKVNTTSMSSTAQDDYRRNVDVDYQRSVDSRRTINMDLSDSALESYPRDLAEDDLFPLMKNLYGHDVPRRDTGFLDRVSGQILYMDLRSAIARRSVAQNSFNNIAALKTKHEIAVDDKKTSPVTYMRAILKNLGIDATDENYMELLGYNPNLASESKLDGYPSYYAQLELLSKRLYENPSFYSGLYDKPENVERAGVALQAIGLMLDREKFESRLRQEMLISVLLSSKLDKAQKAVASNLNARLASRDQEEK